MSGINLIDLFNFAVWGILFLAIVVQLFRSIRIVSTRTALIVERLGKYQATLGPGFHVLMPFIDVVTATQDLREETIDVPPQECFSKDEVKVEVDGVIYMSVSDPVKATYGVTDYRFAAMQLAQTTTRSVIGTLDLDKTFEERDMISQAVVDTLNRAGQGWGVHVHRYEIKNIKPPATVQDAMEKQVNAEREKRAILAGAEGDKQSRISTSEGTMRELINLSEGERQRLINEAEGRAAEILALAGATAASIEKIGGALVQEGGEQAIKLKLSEKLIGNIEHLADRDTSVIFPANLTDMDQLLQALGLRIEEKST
ncbi:MAG: SPFH domain-containing protein [Methylohalobius sp. ZOD2]|uniref:SPFH domain-containing protein n=1 Tax=Methylohalobius crimeensis TaxID=244365 RepID=UPI0003B6F5A2|nr:slipin family protein [Methylohalobius crimeensis]MBN2701860.1 paraslipin [Methylothermaceae bacterium]